MIRECRLRFFENSILTKEMLRQMNQEPKWLFLEDNFRNVKRGIISGFHFFDSNGVSVITKGNILIDGIWYRMMEDYAFDSEKLHLESGKFYSIILRENSPNAYEIMAVEEDEQSDADVYIGKFKYENYRRVFKVPEQLQDLRDKNAFLHDISFPYYNNHGVAICPMHIATCIERSLEKKENRTTKEEIIFQRLLNEKVIAVASVMELLGLDKEINTTVLNDSMIEQLIEKMEIESGDYKKNSNLDEKGSKPQKVCRSF